MAAQLAELNAPIVAIGVGQAYNETLLRGLAQSGGGRPYHLDNLVHLKEVLQLEVETSAREVVTDATARLELVKGVALESITRVYPSLCEVEVRSTAQSTLEHDSRGTMQSISLRLGNIPSGDYSVWALEFSIEGFSRPPSRARLCRLSMRGWANGHDEIWESVPQDIVAEFTGDENAVTAVDMEVLGYVQQKNVDTLLQDAVAQSGADAPRARRTLQQAMQLTQRVRNVPLTQMLQGAIDELNSTGRISPGTRKLVSLNNRTKTVKIGAAGEAQSTLGPVPAEDEIRRLTGA
jgi:Ca-activated chloride channel family protein